MLTRIMTVVGTLCVLACFVACSGSKPTEAPPSPDPFADDPLGPDEEPIPPGPQLSKAERDTLDARGIQPKLEPGTRVVLRCDIAVFGGKLRIAFKKAGPYRLTPGGITAEVVDDPPFGGFFQMQVRVTSGRHKGRLAWVGRDQVYPEAK
jgi:hypothetical protein